MSLIALSLFSLLGLYMALNATTEVRVSDNYESQVQARFAAQAGLNHAQELLRGLRFDYHLKGPDGLIDAGLTDLVQARTYAFRNPLSWATARSMNILDPAKRSCRCERRRSFEHRKVRNAGMGRPSFLGPE